jgi:hypothetical protein
MEPPPAPITPQSVAVVGEFTNQDGPGLDDWFVEVVFRSGAVWTLPTEQAAPMLPEFAQALGVPLELGLAGSTDFASRVLYPPALVGRPLYAYAAIPQPWWRTVLRLGLRSVRSTFTDEVRALVPAWST